MDLAPPSPRREDHWRPDAADGDRKPKRIGVGTMDPQTPHYHGHAGLHGYLPQYTCTAETAEDAAAELAAMHELGRNRTRELKRDLYIELNLHRDGNEYAEVVECWETDCRTEEE